MDGDGIDNENDPDMDGDGVNNDSDDDSDASGSSDECQGYATTDYIAIPNLGYLFTDFTFFGSISVNACNAQLNDTNIDSIIIQSDIISLCPKKYCLIHQLKPSCEFNALNYQPDGYIYRSNVSENYCNGLFDASLYSDIKYIVPDLSNCPNIGFCFLKLNENSSDDTNTENNDSSMQSLDLNSTSLDLKPLLQASNTTNKHLQDLKDKTDETNDKLDDIKDINNKLLTNNQSLKSSLDKISLDSKQSLENQLTQTSKLSTINKSLTSMNKNIADLKKINFNQNQNQMETTKAVNSLLDGLQIESNPFDSDDVFSDGLDDAKDGFTTSIQNSFSDFAKENLFSFSTHSYSVPDISIVLYGKTYPLMSENILNTYPIAELRAFFLFIFALMGFLTVMRTT